MKEADRQRAENKRKRNTESRNTRSQKGIIVALAACPLKKSTGTCPSTSAAFIESESLPSIPGETLNPEPQSLNDDAPSTVEDMDSS